MLFFTTAQKEKSAELLSMHDGTGKNDHISSVLSMPLPCRNANRKSHTEVVILYNALTALFGNWSAGEMHMTRLNSNTSTLLLIKYAFG